MQNQCVIWTLQVRERDLLVTWVTGLELQLHGMNISNIVRAAIIQYFTLAAVLSL